jgi:hypothetical protein
MRWNYRAISRNYRARRSRLLAHCPPGSPRSCRHRSIRYSHFWRWRSRTRQRTHPGRQYRPGLRQHSRIPGGTDRAAVPVLLDEANDLGGGPAARPGRGYRGHQVVTVAEKGAERCPPSRCYLQRVIMLPRRGSCPAGGPGSAGRRGVSGPVPGLLALPVPRRGVHHEATSKALRRARGSGGPRSRARSMPRR